MLGMWCVFTILGGFTHTQTQTNTYTQTHMHTRTQHNSFFHLPPSPFSISIFPPFSLLPFSLPPLPLPPSPFSISILPPFSLPPFSLPPLSLLSPPSPPPSPLPLSPPLLPPPPAMSSWSTRRSWVGRTTSPSSPETQHYFASCTPSSSLPQR